MPAMALLLAVFYPDIPGYIRIKYGSCLVKLFKLQQLDTYITTTAAHKATTSH